MTTTTCECGLPDDAHNADGMHKFRPANVETPLCMECGKPFEAHTGVHSFRQPFPNPPDETPDASAAGLLQRLKTVNDPVISGAMAALRGDETPEPRAILARQLNLPRAKRAKEFIEAEWNAGRRYTEKAQVHSFLMRFVEDEIELLNRTSPPPTDAADVPRNISMSAESGKELRQDAADVNDGMFGALRVGPLHNGPVPEPVVTDADVADNGHNWIRDENRLGNLPFCQICGLVKRADGTSNPCKGPHKLSLRTDADVVEAKEIEANAVGLAKLFHFTYEDLAPQFGYETRPETKDFDPESPNGKLMTATVAKVASAWTRKTAAMAKRVEKSNQLITALIQIFEDLETDVKTAMPEYQSWPMADEVIERARAALAEGEK